MLLAFILVNAKNVNEVKLIINLSTHALREITKDTAKSVCNCWLVETKLVFFFF